MNCITFTDEPNAVTIRVSGRAFENLKKIASAMNGLDWTDNDNTPSSILDNFIVGTDILDELSRPTATFGKSTVGGIGEVARAIWETIDTGFEDGDAEDVKRRKDLENAILAAVA